jgi:hypothetical protein
VGADHARAMIKTADRNLEVVNLPPPVEPADNIHRFFVGLGGLLRIGFTIQSAFSYSM